MNRREGMPKNKTRPQIDILSWDEIDRLSRELAASIPCKPDVIVAVMRGGAVVSTILANELEVEVVASIKVIQGNQVPGMSERSVMVVPLNNYDFRNKDVLIVDDVLDSGESLLVVQDALERYQPKSSKVAVLQKKSYSKFNPDYFVEERTNWIFYPWMSQKELKEMELKIVLVNAQEDV